MENQEKKIEQEYFNLIQTLEKNNYDLLKNNLDINRKKTLGALLWTTEEGNLKLDTKRGKEIWKRATSYLSQNELTDDLSEVERMLSYINSPIRSRSYMLLDSFLGGIWTGITFAGGNGYDVARRLIKKDHHKNVIRLIRE